MQERQIHEIFEISILLKGAHALIECVGGILLALVSSQAITDFVGRATQHELSEDRNDLVATYLLHWAQGFLIETQHFYAYYLLSHGAVKLLLVIGLLREKLWAYPASLIVLGLFIAYQIYRFSFTQSPALIVLSIFDIFVMGLVWHEYRLVRHHLPTR